MTMDTQTYEGGHMRKQYIFISVLLIAALLTSCGLLKSAGVKVITPSSTIISENRDVSGFSAIEFTTFGKVNIIQGDKESLNVSGPDNLVPEISTTVSNGKLTIKNIENITVTTLSSDKMLTFTIVVKDLTSLAVSGAGDVQIEAFSTPSMDINMSGAGKVQQNQVTTDKLNVNISGAGGIDISGQSTQATIDISGAGSVNAADLQVKTANVTISGLGSATVWATDQLTGNISGAGSVSYYGNPQTNTNSSGLGSFKSLGNK
jgi:Putative auto-transporter adhesin, head GIN domain